MAYGSISGRARTNSRKPSAFAVCDRCGIWWNHNVLKWQFDWRGAAVQNIRILVCPPCYDRPQEQLRAIVLPADPTPIVNARTQDFSLAETDLRVISEPTRVDRVTGIPIPGRTYRVTQDCQNRGTNPYGTPVGLQLNAVMPYNGGVQRHYGVPLDALSVIANGTNVIAVTCRAPHGLVTENPERNQVAISGLSNPAADGLFSVVVTSATAFTYQVFALLAGGVSFDADSDTGADSSTPVNVPNSALLTGGSRIWTCFVGLPRNFKRIPQIASVPQADQL